MSSPSPQPLLSVLPNYSKDEALVLRQKGELRGTVFYFPGCGSERLYADVSMASLYLLLTHGIRVVLPPQNLCCGFPLEVNAKKEAAAEIALRNSIILSQIREMLGHINFAAIVVSCGTCNEALHKISCEDIFGCRLHDISGFLLDFCDWQYEKEREQSLLYHTPCHDSMKGEGTAVLRRICDQVYSVANCCSEAGTLALSRPDIANAMRLRKRQQLEIGLERLGKKETTLIATNCPSCLTGLGRNRDLGVEPIHIAVLLANSCGGNNWRKELKELAAEGERVVF